MNDVMIDQARGDPHLYLFESMKGVHRALILYYGMKMEVFCMFSHRVFLGG